jgi:CHRD domain
MRIIMIAAFAAVLTLLLALVCAPTLNASNESHKANLLGFEEVPAISSTGTGEFRAKIDEDNQIIEYELSYENLEGTTTNAAHIHIGQKSVNGGVVAFLCGGGGKPACTATSGTFTGTIGVADIVAVPAQGIAAGEWAEVVRAMRAGKIYANVHTNKHPGGEIRGQVK